MFEFLNVQWLHGTGELDKFVLDCCEISGEFYKKNIEIGTFLSELTLKEQKKLLNFSTTVYKGVAW